jgi:vitamin B12 transporter
VAVFAQSQLHLPQGFSQVMGIRYDVNNRYGNSVTYKAEAAYVVPRAATKVRASFGTGFRGPTIEDLFFPNFGNPNLQPETSESLEAGIEQPFWNRRIIVGVTQFRTNFDDLIQFMADPACVPPFAPFGVCPVNVAKARSEGQEVLVTVTPLPQATVTASYTHLTAKDLSAPGDPLLLRRPRGKAHFGVTVAPIAPLVITADVNYVGQRNDVGGVAGSYWVVRLASQYAVTKWLQLFGRIENVTNQEYEEAFGYETAGFSFFGGLRATAP